MTRRGIAILGVFAAGATAWFAARHLVARPQSDEEQIRALFTAAAKAAEEKRVSDAVAGLSERFEAEGLDKREVKQVIAAHVLRGDWVSVTLTDPQIEVKGDTAEAVLDVVMARSGSGGLSGVLPADATANRITCRLEREDQGWRVVHAKRRPIGVGELLDGAPAPH